MYLYEHFYSESAHRFAGTFGRQEVHVAGCKLRPPNAKPISAELLDSFRTVLTILSILHRVSAESIQPRATGVVPCGGRRSDTTCFSPTRSTTSLRYVASWASPVFSSTVTGSSKAPTRDPAKRPFGSFNCTGLLDITCTYGCILPENSLLETTGSMVRNSRAIDAVPELLN